MEKFTTWDEAIARGIVAPIEASEAVTDARTEYDVYGIADDVISRHVDAHGITYTVTPDAAAFWNSVARHARGC